MKRLIAIPSCYAYSYAKSDEGLAHHSGQDEHRSNIIRQTWYKLWEQHRDEIDLLFFYGTAPDGIKPKGGPDEVNLEVKDDYPSLPLKVQAMFRWAFRQGYDYVFKTDDDTFVHPDRLLAAFNPNLDYEGFVISGGPVDYCAGCGYWLSRSALGRIAYAEWNGDTAEDRWVGTVLSHNRIRPVNNEQMQNCHCEVCAEKYGPKFISFHCWPRVEMMHDFMRNRND